MNQIKLIAIGFVLSGCTLFSITGDDNISNAPDGGIFRSVDGGETWEQKVDIPSVTEAKTTIASVDVLTIEPDPQDRFALYLATRGNGMFYTYTAANAWQKAPVAEQSTIADVAVDPQSKCRIYAASGNQIIRTTDCSRTWQGTYILNNPQISITTIDIEPFNTAVMYAGDASGNVYKSLDFGNSWKTVARFSNRVMEIHIDRQSNGIVYVATQGRGLRKTLDGGETWIDLTAAMKEYNGSINFYRMTFDLTVPDALVHASKFGILKSDDGGESWTPIPLLTGPGETEIFGLAIDPINRDRMYYTTRTTFYKTVDGGKNWSTQPLPTNRIPTHIHIDPTDPNILYMSAANPLR